MITVTLWNYQSIVRICATDYKIYEKQLGDSDSADIKYNMSAINADQYTKY